MTVNAFDEKVDYLIKVQEEVAKRDKMAEAIDEMKSNQKKLERNISSEDKSINEEIESTIKKRKQELESGFNKRINDALSRKKKVSNKRNKEKSELINNRISEETKEIKQEIVDLKQEMKTLFKQHRVSSFCNKKIFYVFFMPKGFVEMFLFIISLLAGVVLIPSVIFVLCKYLFFDGKNINFEFWVTLIISIYLILGMLTYFIISSVTKTKKYDILQRGRMIQNKINSSNKAIAAIAHSINKDKDESQYDLNTYDTRLKKLDKEAKAISDEKLKALKGFDEETVPLIIEEINGRRLSKVESMTAEKTILDEKVAELENVYSEQEIFISKTYVPYLGEEFCKVDKLEILISIMEEGAATTVSEAIAAYKGKSSK